MLLLQFQLTSQVNHYILFQGMICSAKRKFLLKCWLLCAEDAHRSVG